MATGKLGAIVVGTGFGVLTHLRALRAAGFEVLALVGRDAEKTGKRAELFEVPHACTKLSEALALPGVDAVAVATPPHTHCSIVLESVAAGKHVVCEKPFARDADEAQRMLDAARLKGVVHMLGTEFRWATAQALATRAVLAGEIGQPRMATFVFHMPALADPKADVPAWWGDASEGGGWLGAYGSHVIDQVRHTLGEFESVSASLALLSAREWTADDSYSVHFRTVTGVGGVLQSTAGAYGPFVMCLRIAGSKGTLWIEGNDVRVADAKGQRTLDVPDDLKLPPPIPPPGELLVTAYDGLHSMGIDLAPYTKLFEVFAARIRGEADPAGPAAADFSDGLALQRVLDAIRTSARDRCFVKVAS